MLTDRTDFVKIDWPMITFFVTEKFCFFCFLFLFLFCFVLLFVLFVLFCFVLFCFVFRLLFFALFCFVLFCFVSFVFCFVLCCFVFRLLFFVFCLLFFALFCFVLFFVICLQRLSCNSRDGYSSPPPPPRSKNRVHNTLVEEVPVGSFRILYCAFKSSCFVLRLKNTLLLFESFRSEKEAVPKAVEVNFNAF